MDIKSSNQNQPDNKIDVGGIKSPDLKISKPQFSIPKPPQPSVSEPQSPIARLRASALKPQESSLPSSSGPQPPSNIPIVSHLPSSQQTDSIQPSSQSLPKLPKVEETSQPVDKPSIESLVKPPVKPPIRISTKLNGQKPSRILKETVIRTMKKDIEVLKEKGAFPKLKAGVVQTKETPIPEPIKKTPLVELEVPLPSKDKLKEEKQSMKVPLPSSLDISKAKKKEKAQVELIPVAKPARPWLRFAMLGLIALLLGGGFGGFLYWWNYVREPITYYQCQNFQCVEVEGEGTNECLINADCVPPEPQKPISLVSTERTEIIELYSDLEPFYEELFLEQAGIIANEMQERGSLTRILVKIIDNETQEKEYASLKRLIGLAGINIPQSLVNNFISYTFFSYNPERNEMEICQQAEILNSQCYGPRLGLVVKIINKEEVKTLLKEWQTTAVGDFHRFILSETPSEETVDFQYDANPKYQEADIYYKNLPVSSITVNYGFVDDFLVIGTSKYCLYEVLDRLAAMK